MLREVKKPCGVVVSFKYDSLGRRIEKSSDSKIFKFVWDGNNPLHEWAELPEELDQYIKAPKHDLTTWVFEDGFTPSAKLTNQGNFSIISDYLGTPVEAYDDTGKKVWEQELDIYGRVKPRPVKREWGQVVDDGLFDKDFIPFRYQGQYDDSDMGVDLYCNRFRYYDPSLGQYITQDPIGLAGGNPTLYGYVHNPNNEIDPFGLSGWELGGPQVEEVLQGGPFNEKYYKFKGYWWSKDVTGHGQSAFKVYVEKGKYLEWVADADANGQFIEGKHKGETGRRIEKKKLRCKG